MKSGIWVGAVALGAVAGCGVPGEGDGMTLQDDPLTQAVAATNGLRAINGLRATNGLVATNGLRTTNGLATTNGLRTTNGLVSTEGLMTSTEGRLTVDYMVKCALPAGEYMDKADNTGLIRRYYVNPLQGA